MPIQTPKLRIPKLLLTADEAAEALSLSRSTIYVEMAAGRLEFIKIGTARRIPVEALEAWLAASRAQAASERQGITGIRSVIP